eukprot:8909937-Pyramimonas_sp.AAC.1
MCYAETGQTWNLQERRSWLNKSGGRTRTTTPATCTALGWSIRGMGGDQKEVPCSQRGHGEAQRNGQQNSANAPARGGLAAEPMDQEEHEMGH